MLRSNPGLLRLWRWLSDAPTTRLDLIRKGLISSISEHNVEKLILKHPLQGFLKHPVNGVLSTLSAGFCITLLIG
jgi:hypothetical protein